MWICPDCERTFKNTNQSHMCAQVSIDDLFTGKPPNLLLAFDCLLINIIDWEGCTVGATKKAIVFAKEKAWLIVRPMSKELDIKFYAEKKVKHPLIKKTTLFSRKYAHHIRIKEETEVTADLLDLLKKAFKAG